MKLDRETRAAFGLAGIAVGSVGLSVASFFFYDVAPWTGYVMAATAIALAAYCVLRGAKG